jgi:hypothetical protein
MEKLNIENSKIKKYELPEENVIALDENSEIRRRNKDYYKGLEIEGIKWPVEIQGGGESDFKTKKFKIHYPAGDVFLSSVVTIHELGHLRQGEIDNRFAIKELGACDLKEINEIVNHYECEQDAWQRGRERVKSYCPEDLEILENKFKEYKNNGKFKEYKNFKDFFNYIIKVGLKTTEFNDKVELPDEKDKRKKGRLIGRMIKEDKLTNNFFANQDAWRAGEKINHNFAKNFIKKAAEKIAEETYPAS